MSRFSVPNWVNNILTSYSDFDRVTPQDMAELRDRLARYKSQEPEVSVVIPAYNEEKDILKLLSSLSFSNTRRKVEILVVNNNSKDRTQEILDKLGVKSLFQPKQGISFTRQMGLENAKGRFILNADADTIYPPAWIDAFSSKLEDPAISCVYGRYSFIPSGESTRFGLALHEMMAEFIFNIRRRKKDYLNVMGFNFAFRREDGFAIGGFNIKRQRWQDGWMGMMLMKLGKIEVVRSSEARVWTSDRRLISDGGPWKAFWKRVRNQIKRIKGYFFPKNNIMDPS